MSLKRALVTGVTGQDGAYLVRFLLQQGYEVTGVCGQYPIHLFNLERLGVKDKVKIQTMDLTDKGIYREIDWH